MSVHTEFDKGSLVWVKGEIDSALQRSREALQQAATSGDAASLRHARTHLHQAYGALELVELAGLARFCEEAEQLLMHLEGQAEVEVPPVLDQALLEMAQYLERLSSGMPNVALALLPSFRELASARGAETSGAELFFPQLMLDLPDSLPVHKLAASDWPAFVRQRRALFESGLLRYLKGQPNIARVMASALADLAKVQTSSVARAFWWTATALLDALESSRNLSALDLPPRQLLLRLNLQLRKLAEGSNKVAERLFRDMLYVLAQLDTDSNLAHLLVNSFELHSLLPDQDSDMSPAAQSAQREARRLRDELAQLKDAWSRLAAGQRDRLPAVRQQVDDFAAKQAALALPELARLCSGLQQSLTLAADAVSEAFALEFATGLLLADHALAAYPLQADDFELQVDALLARLQNPGQGGDLPHLDVVSQAAQERLLLAQLAHEMRINLRDLEEVLDAFFRNPEARADLGRAEPMLRQVQGALMMLERPLAVSLLEECRLRIQRYAGTDEAIEQQELERLAEALSALGFFVDDLEQGRDQELTLQPLLEQLTGKKHAATAAPEELQQALDVEQEPEHLLPAGAVAELHAPVEAVVPAEPEPQRPLPVSEAAVDAELLEVYLEEAVEVLATIAEHLAISQANPHDREALTVIRRGFHTLKGSGRMVGLNQLGEVAWVIEQVLNKWLQAERPVSRALLELIGSAHQSFAGWVAQLQATGVAAVEASIIEHAAEQVKESLDAPAESADAHAGAASDLAEPLTVSTPDELQIGTVTVSTTLFDIFRDEAAERLATLQHGVSVLQERGIVEESFVLSAHTLGGIVSTTGFREQGELAYALEHALQQLGADAVQHVAMFVEAVGLLSTMLEDIFAQRAPQAAPDCVARLEAMRPQAAADEDSLAIELDADEPLSVPLAVEPAADMLPALDTDFAAALPAAEALPLEAPSAAEPLSELVLPDFDTTAAPQPAAPQAADEPAAVFADELLLADVGEMPPLRAVQQSAAEQALPELSAFELDLDAALAESAQLLASDAAAPAPAEIAAPAEAAAESVEAPAFAELASISLDEPLASEAGLPEPQPELQDAGEALVLEDLELLPELEADELLTLDLQLGETVVPDGAEVVAAEGMSSEPNEVQGSEAIDLGVSLPDEGDILLEAPAAAATETVDAWLESPRLAPEYEPAAEAPELILDAVTGSEVSITLDEALPLPEVLQAESEAAVELQAQAVEPAAGPLGPEALLSGLPLAAAGVASAAAMPEMLAGEAVHAELDPALADDIDEQLLPIFIEEADELLPQLSGQLRALAAPDAPVEEVIKGIKRTLHTIKGSARMSGAMRMGEVAHHMESRLIEAGGDIGPALLAGLDAEYDLMLSLFDELNGRAAAAPAAPADDEAAPASAVLQAAVAREAPRQLLAAAEGDSKTSIRVKSELVDQLVNQAGEVAISRSRIEAEMLALKSSLMDLTENVSRLRTQLRELEIQAESQMQARNRELQDSHGDFDPLEFDRFTRLQEITRFMAESVNDVATVQHNLLKNLDESSAALLAQSRMTKELQQSLMRVRMVPFGSVSDRLYRLTRQAGKETGKKVNLEIKGARVDIDRGVLEKMISPFEHMLRNAIDHGLESPEARLAAGKSEFGEIQLEVRQEGNELVLQLKDDGQGLNLERIRAKGIEKGLIRADQELSQQDICQLIFEPGFSTASQVTQLSGRGIGMDVVKNEISNLGGKIDVSTSAGQGSTFTIHLPLTLAVTQVLLVKAGERLIAIPSVMIEQVQELKQEALQRLYDTREQEWLGHRYRFAYLPRLLGDATTLPEQKRYSTVVLLRSGAERIALHLDELVKNLEVVVKPIGPQLARVPGVVGATVLGTGEIVLIMNPLALLAMAPQISAAAQQATPQGQAAVAGAAAVDEQLTVAPVVMVVDDSLTVRKITSRLLTREGYQVVTAKDGVDALQQLHDVKPSVMLVDIEMPRMDGFELTRNIRADDGTREIPIIMITSRTADKHKNYAFELGVNVFLGKPYQEDELLGHIRHFAGQ
ncbi:hybrid sensor histidine kinase/response regulator [Chitinilyticum litopenaei]|uniref:hybrid sensor histidine kinase/response regulator n=1 Tax=Chitinilyticum litopenaei TaxID=1121276 RepID=UPI00041D95ED|nr:Hpt domain-containing protein [Chitinilyticum litopenaei]